MSRNICLTLFAAPLLLAASAFPQTSTPAASPTVAQDTVDVQHVMDAFHQAVVAHDGLRLSALFIPEGSTWLNVLSDDAYATAKAKNPAAPKVRVSTYKDFVKVLTTSKSSFDPVHSHVQIHSDGTVASVYFDFVFMIDGKPQNQGLETWQLVKSTEGWRIAAITYSSTPPA